MAKQFEIVPFGSWNQNKSIINLVQLEKVISWLEDPLLGTVTMKEIKNNFPSWVTVGGDIGEWVEQGLLVRKDRRYSLVISRFEATQVATLVAQAQRESQLLLMNLYEIEPTLKEKPWLLLVVIFHLRQNVLYQKSIAIEKNSYKFDKVSFFEANPYIYFEKVPASDNDELSGLASYFSSNEKSNKFEEILNIIGDVNPIFFLTMTGRTLELLNENQTISIKKESIFLDVLSRLDYVEKDQTNYYNPYQIIKMDPLFFELKVESISESIEHYLNKFNNNMATEDECTLLTGLILNELLLSVNDEKYILKLV